jgi:hypothetical protein
MSCSFMGRIVAREMNFQETGKCCTHKALKRECKPPDFSIDFDF